MTVIVRIAEAVRVAKATGSVTWGCKVVMAIRVLRLSGLLLLSGQICQSCQGDQVS